MLPHAMCYPMLWNVVQTQSAPGGAGTHLRRPVSQDSGRNSPAMPRRLLPEWPQWRSRGTGGLVRRQTPGVRSRAAAQAGLCAHGAHEMILQNSEAVNAL